ncbi:MAG TPA: GNAT family N-acetyltransferase [Terriglobales bacterium]
MLRNFRPEDAEAFRLLNEAWIEKYFRLEEKDRETLAKPQEILDAGGQIVMALLGEERVGCCALIRIAEGEYEVAKMTVSDKYRGRGFGRAVLAGTIDEARRMGATRLYLETNSSLTPAIKLYESLGFKHVPPEQVHPSPYARADVYMEMHLRD